MFFDDFRRGKSALEMAMECVASQMRMGMTT